MHDDPNYLRDVMENLDKFFPVIKWKR
jgi:hypothetical protein